ncbi:glycosyltransferase family 4 protein [Rhizorhabdus sp.]|uniref:glycosyltransferase family 4 protein n=1 Tax=Rhizorhabdus sp. TaxID=1968843 RepID=UPI0019A55CEE|nr:glycosyltransferase family 4 protein [Rhizorhabdus sp.]MBD3760739.1 glycosyltransferase family 4 protein [Rhizorhabdus sp.]
MLAERSAEAARPIFIGNQHLTAGLGGIAAVSRLTAKVVHRMGFAPHLLSLLDEMDGGMEGVPWRTTRGNRLHFAAAAHLAAFTCDRFLYDSVSTARAHPRIWPLRRPYALWMHGIEVWHSLHRDRARALWGADLAIVNSHATLERFRELHGDIGTAQVCWLATDSDEPPAVRPSFDGPPTLLVLGRVDMATPYKGHAELVACWPDVVAAVPEARLIFAGGGDGLPHLLQWVAASPVAARISVEGFVPQEQIDAMWQRATAFALPSRGEGFGLVYIEAMRHGLPIIASVHDAGKEVNIDGETGFNVDLDRPGHLAERTTSLLSDPHLARTLGAQGHERWAKHFCFSAFEQRLRNILGPFFS